MRQFNKPYDLIKRLLDVISSASGLLLLSPLLCAIAILVRMKLGAPVIFKQQRPGKDGELFTLYKFRSMKIVNEHDDVENDHLRITSFGMKLRSLSLDELPSLVNVLKGDMSVVGPRPLLQEYLDRYTKDQARRHEVRPGITGLAQIHGRNDIEWEDRFLLDVQYVDSRSFRLDSKILFRTISAVFWRRGISQDNHVTKPKFGKNHDD